MDFENPPQIVAKFREERFIEANPDRISLIKIGEYVRTPLYEPSIRAMCLSLSDVRRQLKADLKTNKKLYEAWKVATKIFQARSSYFQSKFHGPEEYCIALICFTLDEPFNIYQEFGRLCQQLVTNSFCYFPFRALFYLLIQAEMRLGFNNDPKEGHFMKRLPTVRHPITITTDLDYSIVEAEEGEESDSANSIKTKDTSSSLEEDRELEEQSPTARKIHSTSPVKQRNAHNVYLGFAFSLSEASFRPRDLVAFTHIMSTTQDGFKLTKLLEETNKPVTLVEVQQVSWSSRPISALSAFPCEAEVVIYPWIKFYVSEIKMIRANVKKVVLQPTSRSFVRTAAEIESLQQI